MARRNAEVEVEVEEEEELDEEEGASVGSPVSEAVKGNRQRVERHVTMVGVAPVMFDRYAGDNDTQLQPEQKMYFMPDGQTLCIPTLNIISFLSAENTPSAPKILLDPRKFKKVARACLNYVSVWSDDPQYPDMIPLTRNGEVVKFGKFEKDRDKLSGIWIHRCVARLDKGIPNPKVRPVLPLPWTLDFNLAIEPNSAIQETQVRWLFDEGGKAIGMGTFRGVFGKFKITKWD